MSPETLDLDEVARRAADGDRDARTDLVRQLQHPIYRLALRFLGHLEGARDATREIVIRVVTHLGSFEGRSKFTTWAYTVATRSLLRTRKRPVESSVRIGDLYRFDRFAAPAELWADLQRRYPELLAG